MKRSSFLLISGVWLLVSGFSFAILDTNSNTLSDLWEKEFNNNQLFPQTFDPQADPDGDGWINEREAAAGTNPFQANPPDGIIRPHILHIPATYFTTPENGTELLTPEAFTLTWPTLTGKQYVLAASPDLTPGSWLSIGPPLIAAGGTTSTTVPITQFDGSTPDKLFWRVTIEDADTDGDSLTNAEENTLGSNPNLEDSDGDGLGDMEEAIIGSNPSTTDSDNDSLSDSVDADPTDVLVNWEKAPAASYILIDVDVPTGSEYFPRDLNDKGEILFDKGIWAGGEWIPLHEVPEVDGSCTYKGETTSFTSKSIAWNSFNDDRQLLGWSEIHFTSGQSAGGDPLDSARSWAGSQSPRDLGEALPMFGYAAPSVAPLGVSANGNAFVSFDYSVETDPNVWVGKRRIVVFSADGNTMTTLAGPGNTNTQANHANFSVSSTGWSAANTGGTDGMSAETYQLSLWNPQLAAIALPSEAAGYFYPIRLTDLPNGKPILATTHSGNNEGIVFLPDSTGTVVYSQKLSGKQIHTFAGDGTAITRDHKIWRNGKLIPVRDLCPRYGELLDDECQIHPLKANKTGLHLARTEDSVGAITAKLLIPVEVAVDADRNGEITFDQSDKTSAGKPFRFWINNDQDDVEADEPILVENPDYLLLREIWWVF